MKHLGTVTLFSDKLVPKMAPPGTDKKRSRAADPPAVGKLVLDEGAVERPHPCLTRRLVHLRCALFRLREKHDARVRYFKLIGVVKAV
jgi:hypothetical protein